MQRLLVTGAAGFIGSAFCRQGLRQGLADIVGFDAMTYAASPRTVEDLRGLGPFRLMEGDIADPVAVKAAFASARPQAVVHFAAETHVDRSIDGPAAFVRTNVLGTSTLLEAARDYVAGLPPAERTAFRFLHISTDEVFGSLGPEGAFTEESPYAPNSPYAASKAAADHLVRAWHTTYGLPTLITNCSNNYGPYQFPEKLIPTILLKALDSKPLPVYGQGLNVRDWLYVDDHAEALWQVLTRGRVGETYGIGGEGGTITNLELVRILCRLMDERRPTTPEGPHERLITFVADRPGHDLRYTIDSTKTRRELGWSPRTSLHDGLAATLDWYLANAPWWRAIEATRYRGERLGLGCTPTREVAA